MMILPRIGATLAVALTLSTSPLLAETASESWADLNYVLCEGIGMTGSGRVEAQATYAVEGNTLVIRDLSIMTRNPHHAHSASASIAYVDAGGNRQTVVLQSPWFPTIRDGSYYSSLLFLPRDPAASGSSSSAQQRAITIRKGSTIDISVTTLFSVPGGNCPAGFSTGWIIE